MTDKRSVEFVDRLTQIFEGHGELLGGETKPSRLVPTNLVDDATVGKETPLRRETSQDLPGGCLNILSTYSSLFLACPVNWGCRCSCSSYSSVHIHCFFMQKSDMHLRS